MLRRLEKRQHLCVAVVTALLVATSPWVAMLGRLPRHAGPLDYAHIGLGSLLAIAAITYLLSCLRAGRRQLYFPWLSGRFDGIIADVRGLIRRQLPSAEGGGLFATLEGFALLTLVATGLTGVAWFLSQGTADALAWRATHVVAARVLIALVVVHAASVSAHVLEFARD